MARKTRTRREWRKGFKRGLSKMKHAIEFVSVCVVWRLVGVHSVWFNDSF